MKTITDPESMSRECRDARRMGRRVGLVPTMGFLHQGHLSLVRRSRSECALTAASVFVNPTQFGPGEDFDRYPRDPDRDASLLEREGADLLFAPEAGSMYPPGHATHVEVAGLGEGLCGAFRPGHFRGVATVVAKLFNIVRPDAAYFGQKDAQQAALIRRMAADLNFGIDIVVGPTVREPDGLAMSSRNVRLSTEERRAAPALHAALTAARQAVERGTRSAAEIRELIRSRLEGTPHRLQYVEVVSASDLEPLARLQGDVLIALASHLGGTRLIDNIIVRLPGDEGKAGA
jgi:pantoate--beta-alanine ligase